MSRRARIVAVRPIAIGAIAGAAGAISVIGVVPSFVAAWMLGFPAGYIAGLVGRRNRPLGSGLLCGLSQVVVFLVVLGLHLGDPPINMPGSFLLAAFFWCTIASMSGSWLSSAVERRRAR